MKKVYKLWFTNPLLEWFPEVEAESVEEAKQLAMEQIRTQVNDPEYELHFRTVLAEREL